MLNPATFEYDTNISKDLFNFLKSKGFDVYFPGIKLGECLSPYLVVKSDISTKHSSVSTDIDLYTIMIYVPKDSYSTMGDEVLKVRKAMKKIEPLFLPYGNATPSYYDDSIKGHMVSIDYKNYRKML